MFGLRKKNDFVFIPRYNLVYNERKYELLMDKKFPFVLFYGEDKIDFIHENAGGYINQIEGTFFMDYKLLTHNHKCLEFADEFDISPMVISTENASINPEWVHRFNPFFFCEYLREVNAQFIYGRIEHLSKIIWNCISSMDIPSDVNREQFYLFLEEIVRFMYAGVVDENRTFDYMLKMLLDANLYSAMVHQYTMLDNDEKVDDLSKLEPFFPRYCRLLYDLMRNSFATDKFLKVTNNQEHVLNNKHLKSYFVDYNVNKNSDVSMLATFYVFCFLEYQCKAYQNGTYIPTGSEYYGYIIPEDLNCDVTFVNALSQTPFIPVIATSDKNMINKFNFNTILFGSSVSEAERNAILNNIKNVRGDVSDLVIL